MECEPTESDDVLKVAVVTPALVLTLCAAPRLLPPSLNCTVPVGEVPVPEPGAVTLIVAVKVTKLPEIDGFTEELTAVVVEALFTVWDTLAEVLPLKLLSPANMAVMVAEPCVVDVRSHVPAATVPVQLFVPSLTVTFPVGVPLPGELTATE
jgi:hypothetical protein